MRTWGRLVVGLALPLLLSATVRAGGPASREPWLVRAMPTADLPAPAGLAWVPDAERLVVVGADGTWAAAMDLAGDLVQAGETRGLGLPRTLAFEPRGQRFLVYDPAAGAIRAVRRGPDGLPGGVLPGWSRPLAAVGPQAIAVDGSGTVVLLDAAAQRLLSVGPGARIASRELPPDLPGAPRALAWDPATGSLAVLSLPGPWLHRLDAAGKVVESLDLSSMGLVAPGGMAFAPSGDRTDDPERTSLYVADAAGFVVEIGLLEPAEPAGERAAAGASLVATLDTSKWSPPSPDPAGLAWNATRGRLLVVDCEVDEMSIYAGTNVWQVTTAGSVLDRANTLRFSKEPTDVAYNPATGRWFISDDDKRLVFEITLGADGVFGTADDTWTSFSTTPFNSGDPEGLSFDTRRSQVVISDGVNAEVYRVSPGANGRFDGVPPAGDDQVVHFDTAQYGLNDPEGVDYNADSDTLFIVGRGVRKVVETTIDGARIRDIDLSFLTQLSKASGVAYAPSSVNPSAKSLYISDRAVDNNSNPNENDGKIFEVNPGGPPTTCGNGVREGTESCDGSDLGGQTCQTQGYGSGTLSCAADCTFNTSGCNPCDLDGVCDPGETHDLCPAECPVPSVIDVRVAAGSDDAEESASGAVDLASSDLELVDDATNQTVGLRFPSVAIPQGSVIQAAWVQFKVDETGSTATTLTIRGQAADNPATFAATALNVSSRPRTAASVAWAPAAWPAVGEAGAAQRTPDLRAVVQEIVDRPGWASGNALAVIVTGSGRRTAEAFEGDAAGAPLLHVELQQGGTCGDGVRQAGEACDGADLGSASCADRNCTGGTPSCTASCTVDYGACTGCSNCGNGVKEGSEACDGADLGGETCQSQGFGSGTLGCTAQCALDTSSCSVCDLDGVCDPGESCTSCPAECDSGGPTCGNDLCETANGEDCRSCPSDCNGVQAGKTSRRYCCGDGDGTNPVGCGDARCTANGNTCSTVATPSFCCGNGTCETGETSGTCGPDCAP